MKYDFRVQHTNFWFQFLNDSQISMSSQNSILGCIKLPIWTLFPEVGFMQQHYAFVWFVQCVLLSLSLTHSLGMHCSLAESKD